MYGIMGKFCIILNHMNFTNFEAFANFIDLVNFNNNYAGKFM